MANGKHQLPTIARTRRLNSSVLFDVLTPPWNACIRAMLLVDLLLRILMKLSEP